MDKKMNFDFKNYKKNDIHGTIRYPATMVAPMQKFLIADIVKKNNISTMLDPFHGSGTTLYETFLIDDNIKLFGIDINPYAHLIAKVKLQGVSENIKFNIKVLINFLDSNETFKIHSFNKVDKWFREDIIVDLSKIKSGITQIQDKKDREYFWYCMSSIVRKYCNSRTSTFKLHIKKSEDISKMKNFVIQDFIYLININLIFFNKISTNHTLQLGNSIFALERFKENSIDLVVTSPPYGDNATTITYGQFSILPLHWIDFEDLTMAGDELSTFSKIDSKSLGGSIFKEEHLYFEYYSYLIEQIAPHKQQKVIAFFEEYLLTMKKLSFISNNYIVITLGNRTVDNINIDLTHITKLFFIDNGFTLENNFNRNILNKRMASKISSIKGNPVSSIKKEYVLVLRKKIYN